MKQQKRRRDDEPACTSAENAVAHVRVQRKGAKHESICQNQATNTSNTESMSNFTQLLRDQQLVRHAHATDRACMMRF